MFVYGCVDGVLLLDLCIDDWWVFFFEQFGLLMVLVGVYDQLSLFFCVWIDDVWLICEFIVYFCDVGYICIVYVFGLLDYVYLKVRFDVYVEEIGSDELLCEGDFIVVSGCDIIVEFLVLFDFLIVVFYFNDMMVIVGLFFVWLQGFFIFWDFVIFGFDDDYLLVYFFFVLISVLFDLVVCG